MRALVNPGARRDAVWRGLFDDAEHADARAFYAARPELAPTPLVALPALASELGIGTLHVKNETGRHGVEAFKIIGVRYAVHRLGRDAARRGLVCATAGNHGRAVARVAREEGVPCAVFVPAARTAADGAHPAELRTRAARVSAMRADGARVVDVGGSYEDAVREAASHAALTGASIVSDTSWAGYDEIPRLIMAGYTQLFEEARRQWPQRPDAILVQGGVGGLVCAAASWAAWRFGPARPSVVACEPEEAACLLESAAAGTPVSLPGPLATIMAGLRCGEPSPAAWPAIASGVDVFASVSDDTVLETMERLRGGRGGDPRIEAGPSGACGVATLVALTREGRLDGARRALRLDRASRVLAVVTEGP